MIKKLMIFCTFITCLVLAIGMISTKKIDILAEDMGQPVGSADGSPTSQNKENYIDSDGIMHIYCGDFFDATSDFRNGISLVDYTPNEKVYTYGTLQKYFSVSNNAYWLRYYFYADSNHFQLFTCYFVDSSGYASWSKPYYLILTDSSVFTLTRGYDGISSSSDTVSVDGSKIYISNKLYYLYTCDCSPSSDSWEEHKGFYFPDYSKFFISAQNGDYKADSFDVMARYWCMGVVQPTKASAVNTTLGGNSSSPNWLKYSPSIADNTLLNSNGFFSVGYRATTMGSFTAIPEETPTPTTPPGGGGTSPTPTTPPGGGGGSSGGGSSGIDYSPWYIVEDS